MAPRHKRKRHSNFQGLRQKATTVDLHGAQQYRLVDELERMSFGRYSGRSIWIGRKDMGKRLAKDPRNTRRRLDRLCQKGLLRVVVGGGRKRGARTPRLYGLANRYYPGEELLPKVITDGWIRQDEERQRRKFEPLAVQEEAPWSAAVERVKQRFEQQPDEARAGP